MGKAVKVLYVEDEQRMHMLAEQGLKMLGFDVIHALHGKEALEQLATSDPDVIILDLYMPEMDGFEFLRKYPGPVPVVLVSAWADAVLPREVYAKFTKPVVLRQIADTLRAAVAAYRFVEGEKTKAEV